MALFVHTLTPLDQVKLQELCETYRDEPWLLKHLEIILLSSKRMKPPEIARQLDLNPVTVVKWIKRFNQEGLAFFETLLAATDKAYERRRTPIRTVE